MAERRPSFGILPSEPPPLDLNDYAKLCTSAAQRRPVAPTRITASDDWPTAVPITENELRILEAHFAEVLDELFGPSP
jgi:hypothetical protein